MFKYKNVDIYGSSLEMRFIFLDTSAHTHDGQLPFTEDVHL